MNAIRVAQQAANIDALTLPMVEVDRPAAGPGQCVIEVRGASVNPSDVKAALGAMPHAVWPRIPGRDYAGVVIEGPAELLGKEVWGSGGELGIRRDGSHARYLVVDAASVRAKPAALSLFEAGAVGVPFITAFEGFRRAGLPRAGEVVLVCGGNGKVGQAAIQLATRAGARVFALGRSGDAYIGHASGPVDMIDASSGDAVQYLRDQTGGHGADIVYNTVGSPYFAAANGAMAIGARQIFIATVEKPVPFDIFAFYRGQHTYVGIDSLALDSVACANILDELAPGFNDGSLRPFPIAADCVFDLANAKDAYTAVLAGARHRIVVRP
ncbi:MAG: oxidoreductase [Massilia sp.]|nr:oxidoreductase [Massilia sp.]